VDKITVNLIGKRYKKDWIFRDFSHDFLTNNAYVIQGSNGSGKSTLLKICASYLSPTLGNIRYLEADTEITINKIHHYITYAAPYMELPEEFTPLEILDFHLSFKTLYNNMSKEEFLDFIGLSSSATKPVNKFSSGMKQRMKLGLAILSKSDLLLLDEPAINLDSAGIELYHNMINKFGNGRIILVCSNNISEEFSFCQTAINVNDYKK
jgi:ABC-type multidrug transport system ATPase subunit